MSRNELHEEWERRIALFKASRLTQSRWCETNDISIHQLRYWLKRISGSSKTQERKTTWVPMTIEDEVADVSNETLQIKVGQAIIEVKPDFTPTFLANVYVSSCRWMNYRNKLKTSGGIYTMKTTIKATPSLKIRNNTEKAINRLRDKGLAS